MGFPGGSDDKVSACNAETHVRSLGREDPLEKEMAIHSSFLAWEIPERSLAGSSPWDCRVGHDWATNTLQIHNQSTVFKSDLGYFSLP